MSARVTFAPKTPLQWIVRLYELDAGGRPDDELALKIGHRLWDRCNDLLMVASSQLRCALCENRFTVPWIGVPADESYACPQCGWRITAGEYHDLIEHRDLLGGTATPEVARFVERFPLARDYAERLRLIDALVHAIHRTGGRAARNLVEGRASEVIRVLDVLSGHTNP
jgi:DNA-directed RNA polymerase subunit RPC12/RpoP